MPGLDLNPYFAKFKELLGELQNPEADDERLLRCVILMARTQVRPDEVFGTPLCVVQQLDIDWQPNEMLSGGFAKEGRAMWRLIFVFEVLGDEAGLTGPLGALYAASLIFGEVANWVIDDDGHRVDIDRGPYPFDVALIQEEDGNSVPPPPLSGYAIDVSHPITFEP